MRYLLVAALLLGAGTARAVTSPQAPAAKSDFVYPAFSPPLSPLTCGQDGGLGCLFVVDAGMCVRLQAQGTWGYSAVPTVAPDAGFLDLVAGTGCSIANFSPGPLFNQCANAYTFYVDTDGGGNMLPDGGGLNLPDGGGLLLLGDGGRVSGPPLNFAGVGPIANYAGIAGVLFPDAGCTVPTFATYSPLFYSCASTSTPVLWQQDAGSLFPDGGGFGLTDGGGEILYTDGGPNCGLAFYRDAGFPTGPDGGETFICPIYFLGGDGGCGTYLNQDAGNQWPDGGGINFPDGGSLIVFPDAGLYPIPAPLWPDGGGTAGPEISFMNLPDGGVIFNIWAGVLAYEDAGPTAFACTTVSPVFASQVTNCTLHLWTDGGDAFPDAGGWVVYPDAGTHSVLPDGGLYVYPDGGDAVATYADGGTVTLPAFNYMSDGDKEAWCFEPASFGSALLVCSVDGGTFGEAVRESP